MSFALLNAVALAFHYRGNAGVCVLLEVAQSRCRRSAHSIPIALDGEPIAPEDTRDGHGRLRALRLGSRGTHRSHVGPRSSDRIRRLTEANDS
jgi:hypothetical protein